MALTLARETDARASRDLPFRAQGIHFRIHFVHLAAT